MKTWFLALLLLAAPAFSHNMHGHAGQGAGALTLLWNLAEIGAHVLEFAGYKQSFYKSTCCGCSALTPHSHGASRIEQAYHVIELVTHGVNMFDVTAKMSESVSESIEEYVSPVLISGSAIVFNAGVIIYRIFDAKKQFALAQSNSKPLGYAFVLWSLFDAAMHTGSIYIAVSDSGSSEPADICMDCLNR